MIWQFGELGYDISIDFDCRVCNKPIRWEYLEEEDRNRLYQVWSALIRLKTGAPAFRSGDFELFVSGPGKRIEINHPDMDVRIIGNFGVQPLSVDPGFSRDGWWYDYFTGDSLLVSGDPAWPTLEPGAYHIYTSKRLETPEIPDSGEQPEQGPFSVFPNPVKDLLYLTPSSEEAVVRIYALTGQIAMKLALEQGERRIDLSELRQGLYILQYTPKNGASSVTRVMKY